MNKNSVAKNTIWIISCKIIQSLLGMVISMMSARYLGPSGFGAVNYAASIVAFVAPLMKLGYNHILVNEIVNKPEEEGEVLGTAIVFNSISAVACIVGISSFVLITTPDDIETLIICILYSLSLVFQATEMIQYWFQAKLISHYMSLTGLGAYLIVSMYRIFLLVTEKSIYWFAVSQAMDYFIISLVLLIIYNRVGNQKLKVSFKRACEMFSKSKYFIVSSMMITIFAQTDKIMLKMMLGNETVGIYSAAETCAGMTSFVFAAIIDSSRPSIFESKKRSVEQYENSVVNCYSCVTYLSLAQSVMFTVFAGLIVDILYGSEYVASVGVLQLVVWYTTFSYLGSVRSVWILAENKQKYLWIINLSGAVTNIILNFILIPLMGVMGAALASLFTQIFTNVIMGFILKPIRENNRLMLKSLNPMPLIEYIKIMLMKIKRGNK